MSKRGSERSGLSKEQEEELDAMEGTSQIGSMSRASADVMKKRRVIKARKPPKPVAAVSSPSNSSNPFGSVSLQVDSSRGLGFKFGGVAASTGSSTATGATESFSFGPTKPITTTGTPTKRPLQFGSKPSSSSEAHSPSTGGFQFSRDTGASPTSGAFQFGAKPPGSTSVAVSSPTNGSSASSTRKESVKEPEASKPTNGKRTKVEDSSKDIEKQIQYWQQQLSSLENDQLTDYDPTKLYDCRVYAQSVLTKRSFIQRSIAKLHGRTTHGGQRVTSTGALSSADASGSITGTSNLMASRSSVSFGAAASSSSPTRQSSVTATTVAATTPTKPGSTTNPEPASTSTTATSDEAFAEAPDPHWTTIQTVRPVKLQRFDDNQWTTVVHKGKLSIQQGKDDTSKHRLTVRDVAGHVKLNILLQANLSFTLGIRKTKRGTEQGNIRFRCVNDVVKGPETFTLTADASTAKGELLPKLKELCR